MTLGQFVQSHRSVIRGTVRPRPREARAFQCFARQIRNARFELGGEFVLPPAEGVGPRLNRVFVDRVFVNVNRHPASDRYRRESWRSRASGFPENAPFQNRRHDVVSILENVGFDDQILSHDALDRIAPAIDQRLEIFDNSGGKPRGMGHQSLKSPSMRKPKSAA